MNRSLRIVADDHIWQADRAFSSLPGYQVALQTVKAEVIDRALVRDADILLVRSSTRVNASLLAGSSVRFVATATIGTDHVDTRWLQQQGIGFASAAGSSTGSVLEYITTVLLELHHQGRMNLSADVLGVIGVGRIGSGLLPRCQALGLRTLCNDPPRAVREPTVDFCSLSELLRCADVLTLHTPLEKDGDFPTWHLIDGDALSAFRGRGIINAGRGACVDNTALLAWLDASPEHWAVLDCWEHEPEVMADLLHHPGLVIATPHIAGHSLDGKAANTAFIYRDVCSFLGVEPVWQVNDDLPEPRPVLEHGAEGDVFASLHQMVTIDYPLARDHQMMRSWPTDEPAEFSRQFRQYRRHYPVRRAWSACPWRLSNEEVKSTATGLGYTFNTRP